MAYVVVVFAIINSAALVLVAYFVLAALNDAVAIVGSTVEDEIRKQDDRIEKRLAKVQGTRQNDEETQGTHSNERVEVGRPLRR